MYSKLLLSFTFLSFLTWSNLHAIDSIDEDLGGFDTEISSDESADDLAGFGDDEGNDDLAGFGDDDEIASESSAPTIVQEPKRYSLTGDIAFKTSYGYQKHEVDGVEYSGINQAQTSLFLQYDYKFLDDWKLRISADTYYDGVYDISSNDYNQDTLDTYRTQLMLNDAYIQGRITSDFDIKIGRQIVVWGKSDSIRITDVINPLDNRLPGMTDIEDLRLSVGMAKFDYYVGSWNLSAMLIGENRIMIEASPRGEFFPVDSISSTAPNPFMPLITPTNSIDNLQYAFAMNGIFSGWDLSFYASDVLDQKWHIDPITKKREVSKIKMLGSAINIAKGSWLLKSELAYINGIRYNSTQDEKNRFDSLVGVDYMGIKDSVLSLEIANRHIFDYENQMGGSFDYVNKDEMQTAIRITRSFQNDSINTTVLISMFGQSWQEGGFKRVWVEYDVVDAVVANVGFVDYIGGDKVFMEVNKNNDRIFADISYSF